jgi:hypothetical protein
MLELSPKNGARFLTQSFAVSTQRHGDTENDLCGQRQPALRIRASTFAPKARCATRCRPRGGRRKSTLSLRLCAEIVFVPSCSSCLRVRRIFVPSRLRAFVVRAFVSSCLRAFVVRAFVSSCLRVFVPSWFVVRAFVLPHRCRCDRRTRAALNLQRLHDQRELVDLLACELVELQVLQ